MFTVEHDRANDKTILSIDGVNVLELRTERHYYCCGITLCGNIVKSSPWNRSEDLINNLSDEKLKEVRKGLMVYFKRRHSGNILQFESRINRDSHLPFRGSSQSLLIKLLGIDPKPTYAFYNRNSGNWVGIYHFNFGKRTRAIPAQ